MALSIQINQTIQANDNTILRVEDGTGAYDAITNTGGWGSPNPEVTAIDGSTVHLYLDIIYTDVIGTETIYDQLELYSEFGPFTDIIDLNFELTPAMLISGGDAMGTAEDVFLDGWYNITYSFIDDGVTYVDSTVEEDELIDGVVKNKVYKALKSVPYINEFKRFTNDFKEWEDILYPLYYYSLLQGMESEVSLSRKNEVLVMLGTLQRLLIQIS